LPILCVLIYKICFEVR